MIFIYINIYPSFMVVNIISLINGFDPAPANVVSGGGGDINTLYRDNNNLSLLGELYRQNRK